MTATNTSLSASLEDYIEVIFHIIAEKKVARGKEIAGRLKVSRASVTEALQTLARKGLINYAPYEVITMTGAGKEAARDVIRRHRALKDFFIKVLAINEKIAEQGACRVEHAAPPEIIERLTRFVAFIEECPRGGADLLRCFAEYREKGRAGEQCRRCVAATLERSNKG
ncbi:MAG: metal-dependent transcriptional regulator [Desulfobacterales bacterium]|nr:metal-dependent transcriptional regulator [Desulfobacterales bacterium]